MPKLATKVMGWLDPQPDDIILDIGCGGEYLSSGGLEKRDTSFDIKSTDGILDVEMAKVLAQGKGKLHGIDSSRAMIDASVKAIQDSGVDNSTFEGRCAT